MARVILAIDQGTTGTTAMLVDGSLAVLGRSNCEFEQIYPRPAWVEHDPEAIWRSVKRSVEQLLTQTRIAPRDVAAVGITNQRETTVLWERASSRPVHNAIVWQDRRTADLCQELRRQGLQPLFSERTGLVLDPYFSATKIRWLLDNVQRLRQRAQRGEIAFGTIDSYLIHRLSGGSQHISEISNASRTLLFDLRKQQWDAELLDKLQIPSELLPQVVDSSAVFAETHGLDFLPDGIPICGAAGDQQAALFGQACFDPGDAKCTYGTGAFLLLNTGTEACSPESGVLTTIAWRLGGKIAYALEGSAFIAGAAVQWLRDGLGIVERADEIEALARQVDDSAGVVFVPALAGLGAPHWRPEARGAITGLTRGSTAAHLARATLEGICLQIVDLAVAMKKDSGQPLHNLKVDGGAAANDLLMQIQADLAQREIVRPKVIETTALGAACLAGLAIGIWPDTSSLRRAWQEERRFVPQMAADQRQRLLEQWQSAVSRC